MYLLIGRFCGALKNRISEYAFYGSPDVCALWPLASLLTVVIWCIYCPAYGFDSRIQRNARGRCEGRSSIFFEGTKVGRHSSHPRPRRSGESHAILPRPSDRFQHRCVSTSPQPPLWQHLFDTHGSLCNASVEYAASNTGKRRDVRQTGSKIQQPIVCSRQSGTRLAKRSCC